LVSGSSILGREEEDWVDGLFAILNDSHDTDGVGHFHLGALGVTSAWGVKYADYICTVLNHDLLAVPSGRLTGPSTHNGLKTRVGLHFFSVCLNVVFLFNHFNPCQELDGCGLAYTSLSQRYDQGSDPLEVWQLLIRGI
jgi:hypothetical protein